MPAFNFNFSADLACYSLSLNQQNVSNNHLNKKISDSSFLTSGHSTSHSPSSNLNSISNSNSNSTSKLDLLIHTATNTSNNTPYSNNSSPLSSQIPLNPVKTAPLSTSLDILCLHAQNELNSHFVKNESQSSSNKLVKNISTNNKGNTANKVKLEKNIKSKDISPKENNSNITKGGKITKERVRKSKKETPSSSSSSSSVSSSSSFSSSSSASNIAIKLASPSIHTKRQRSGPSCDCCRSRKIKCDSEIFILSTLSNIPSSSNNSTTTTVDEKHNSHIAHCKYISTDLLSNYQYYKIIKDEEHSLNNKLTSFNYLQFKPCSACLSKNLNCSFSKGFTRNDIVKFNKSEKFPTILNNRIDDHSLPTPSPSIQSPIDSDIDIDENDQKLNKLKQQEHVKDETIENEPLIKERKSSKKTSCKTCRFKKIKCVKINNNDFCQYCQKKNIVCLFE